VVATAVLALVEPRCTDSQVGRTHFVALLGWLSLSPAPVRPGPCPVVSALVVLDGCTALVRTATVPARAAADMLPLEVR